MEITISEILGQLVQRLNLHSETALLDAQVLVAHHLNQPRSWILAHPETTLSQAQYEEILQSGSRLESGEPLPYVIGHWEFFGLDFIVTPDVLIPRPETELVVERAINWLQLHPNKRRVVDVGTGSGIIGISIAKNVPDARLVLTDISLEALEVARHNAEKHGLLDQVELAQVDLLGSQLGPFDLICANLPYIPTVKLAKLPVARHEPPLALNGSESGTGVIRRLLEEAKGRLIAGGMLLMEIDASQGDEISKLAANHYPQSKVQILKDLAGLDRCIEIDRPYRIVHLCPPQEWLEQRRLGEFRDQSLVQDGFIHCSQGEQIIEIANRIFKGYPELVILWINPGKLSSKIRWEQADGCFYAHIYGPINMQAIEAATPLLPGRDGIYRYIFN